MVQRLVAVTLFPYTTLFRSMAPRARALAADRFVADHRDRRVEGLVHPGLEQQRDLDDARRRCGIGGQIGRATSELQSRRDLVCRLLLEKKNIVAVYC